MHSVHTQTWMFSLFQYMHYAHMLGHKATITRFYERRHTFVYAPLLGVDVGVGVALGVLVVRSEGSSLEKF